MQIKLENKGYTCLSRLGHGSLAELQLYQREGKVLVSKNYHLPSIDSKGLSYQLFVQVAVLKQISHPGLPQFYASYIIGQHLSILMQFMPGGDIFSLIRMSGGRVASPISRFIIAQCLVVLKVLHSKGVIHRDIKPQNIMLDSRGHVKLIDFATAKLTNPDFLSVSQHDSITKLNPEHFDARRDSLVGTPGYISARRIQTGEVGEGDDMWSLGVVMCRLRGCTKLNYLTTNYLSTQQIEVLSALLAHKTVNQVMQLPLFKDTRWQQLYQTTSLILQFMNRQENIFDD